MLPWRQLGLRSGHRSEGDWKTFEMAGKGDLSSDCPLLSNIFSLSCSVSSRDFISDLGDYGERVMKLWGVKVGLFLSCLLPPPPPPSWSHLVAQNWHPHWVAEWKPRKGVPEGNEATLFSSSPPVSSSLHFLLGLMGMGNPNEETQECLLCPFYLPSSSWPRCQQLPPCHTETQKVTYIHTYTVGPLWGVHVCIGRG